MPSVRELLCLLRCSALSGLLATAAVLLSSIPAYAQCNGRWLTSAEQVPPGLNGPVNALAVLPNGDLVAGGEFTTTNGGVTVNSIARWNGFNWVPLGSGMSVGRVNALAVLRNGDLVAGGSFLTAGGVIVNNIARWNGSSWSALGSGVGSTVNALVLMPNDDLVVGGSFSFAGGLPCSNIARWSGSSWKPLGSGTNGAVNALAVLQSGEVVAGGDFSSAGGITVSRIARWNGTSWFALGSGVSGILSSFVQALALLPNGDLLVGGAFGLAGGVAANNIARWDGSSWTALDAGVSQGTFTRVSALAVLPSGEIIAGGNFAVAGGVVAKNMARWNGVSWGPLGVGMVGDLPSTSTVKALAVLASGDVVAGGEFTIADGATVHRIARWNGSSWNPLGLGIMNFFSPSVKALAILPNGDVVLGGTFTSAGGVNANLVARWDGSTLAPLGSGIDNESGTSSSVLAFGVLPNGDVVAGGNFISAGGVTVNRVTRWNGISWVQLASGMTNSRVSAFAMLPNGDLVAGGNFEFAGGVRVNNIARWNGTSWLPLGSGLNGTVNALAVLPNGDLVAGGDFTTAGGVTAGKIARWNGAVWASLGNGVQGGRALAVNCLAVLPSGDLVVGGLFTTAGGVMVNNLARWNGLSWASFGSGTNGAVTALARLPHGDLVAGGNFTTAGGVTTNRIARWNGSAWSALGSGMNTMVRALAVLPSGELIAGGDFTSAGGVTSGFWARWTDTGVPWIARQPLGQSRDIGQTVTLSATCASGYDFNGTVSLQWQRNGVPITSGPGGASPGGGTVSGATASLTTTGLTATLAITNAKPSDAGSYTVVFSNSCGSVTSLPAIVTVEAACPSDLNNDGLVDDADFSVFAVAYDVLDCAAPAMPAGCPADLNRDGLVNDDDFQVFVVAYNEVVCP